MSNKIGYQIKQNYSIVLLIDGKLLTISNNDINYDIILKAVKAEDWDTVRSTMNIRKAIATYTNGRVEIFGDEIWVDKKKIPKAVADRIIPVLKAQNFDLEPVFRLLENIGNNPEEFSRNELYLFLEQCDLPITPDGHFLAYKMVGPDYMDIYTGNTHRNQIGDIVQMDRNSVDKNRHRTCSSGLHFCSYNYLKNSYYLSANNHLMVVKINPADVVSIPSDYNNSKGRCWRYIVVDEIYDKTDLLDRGFTKAYNSSYENNEDSVDEISKTNYGKKLDENKVKNILRDLKTGNLTIEHIAAHYGCSARQVARIRDGKAWKHLALVRPCNKS